MAAAQDQPMKPFLNLSEISEYEASDEGPFKEKYARVGDKIGAKKLGYSVVVLEPGFKVCPFHNHHVNEEMFLILEGEGTLRFGENEYAIKKDDIIACPPGGTEVAHQIINTGTSDLRYLCLSTNEPFEICEYPDSNKALALAGERGNYAFRHITRLDDAVDYYHGER
jgi:uncharacterized cupin superfamily protein